MTIHHEAGKGSTQRPTDQEKFNQNWDNIFKKKPEDTKSNPPSKTNTK